MKNSAFLGFILIIILGITVYANSLNGKFIWDDNFLVKNNIHIKSWSNMQDIFTKHIGAGTEVTGGKSPYYRPLQIVTYMIDYSLWGLNAKGYHITNVLIHILVALSVYWLINILSGNKIISLFTGIFFVVHPVHTEVVSYISSRADSLSALFIFLCLIFYIKYLNLNKVIFYFFMLLSYVLAILSREGSLIFPLLLLLYHYAFKKKLKIPQFLPILGITFTYILLRNIYLKPLLSYAVYNTTFLQRLPGFFIATTNYIRLLFLPFDLHMGYGDKLFSFIKPNVLLGILVLFLFSIYAFRKKSSNHLIFFGIFWFFIAGLPQSNLYPVGAYMAEHWLYIPSIGFFLVFSILLNNIWNLKNGKLFVIIIVTSLIGFYSYLTIKQNNYWKNPINFYETTLEYIHDDPRLYDGLGISYRNVGRSDKAITFHKKAIEIAPNFAPSYMNLGNAYFDIGETEKAISLFKKAIEIRPHHPIAYHNLGIVYKNAGNIEEAILLYKKAIEIAPYYGQAHVRLGEAYNDIGKTNEAIELYKKALQIDPHFAEAHNNLAEIYYSQKQYDLAVEHCVIAIRFGYNVRPEFAKLLLDYTKTNKLHEK